MKEKYILTQSTWFLVANYVPLSEIFSKKILKFIWKILPPNSHFGTLDSRWQSIITGIKTFGSQAEHYLKSLSFVKFSHCQRISKTCFPKCENYQGFSIYPMWPIRCKLNIYFVLNYARNSKVLWKCLRKNIPSKKNLEV